MSVSHYSQSTKASLSKSKCKTPKNDVKTTRFSTSKQTDSSKSNLPKNEIKMARFSTAKQTDRDSKTTSTGGLMLRHSLSTSG